MIACGVVAWHGVAELRIYARQDHAAPISQLLPTKVLAFVPVFCFVFFCCCCSHNKKRGFDQLELAWEASTSRWDGCRPAICPPPPPPPPAAPCARASDSTTATFPKIKSRSPYVRIANPKPYFDRWLCLYLLLYRPTWYQVFLFFLFFTSGVKFSAIFE